MKIALSGKMCSGKTSIRKHLEITEAYEGGSFADPIKTLEFIQATYPREEWNKKVSMVVNRLMPVNSIPGMFKRIRFKQDLLRAFNKFPQTPHTKNRELLQYIGTEVGRRHDPDIWVKYLLRRAEKWNKFVIDDVRFPNELKALNKAGFITIRLVVSPGEQEKRIKRLYGNVDPAVHKHESETALDGYEKEFKWLVDADVPLDKMLIDIMRILNKEGMQISTV